MDTFDSTLFTRWLLEAQGSLRDSRSHIDALNVFPVPDGDTGTNLYLTWEAACSGLPMVEGSFADTASLVARQGILGARGNSGVIMSALLRDVCQSLVTDPEKMAQALRAGALGAISAVATPIEGTILTVAQAAASQAERVTAQGGSLRDIAVETANAAYAVLLKTPDMLEQLRAAGVVDAGGFGLVVVLDSLVSVVTGEKPHRDFQESHVPLVSSTESMNPAHMTATSDEFEVMYQLSTTDIGDLSDALTRIGTSVMVTGVQDVWRIHVHVSANRIGHAVNEGLSRGIVSRVDISQLDRNVNRPALNAVVPLRNRQLIGVTHGQGVAEFFAQHGVLCVPTPPRQQPSAAELLAIASRSDAREFVFLPSDRDAQAVAEIASEELNSRGKRTAVIPTRAITQSLAAVAVHDPSVSFDNDVVSMTRSASATRYGAITTASRTGLTMAGPCEPGDILGLIDGDISVIGSSLVDTTSQILDKMLAPGAELVTLVMGSESSHDLADSVQRWLKEQYPLVDIDVIQGGQPLWPVIIGVE